MENPPSLGPLNRVAIASSQIAGLVRLHEGIELTEVWCDLRRVRCCGKTLPYSRRLRRGAHSCSLGI